MSIALTDKAWDTEIRPTALKVVFLCLCNHADDKRRRCWPSVSLIAKKCNIDARSVRRHLSTLRKLGHIAIVEHGSGGRAMTTVYEILRRNPDSGVPLSRNGDPLNPDRNDTKTLTEMTETLTEMTENPDSGVPPTVRNRQEPSIEPSLAAPKASAPGNLFPIPNDLTEKTSEAQRPKDPAFEIFNIEFKEHRQIPYRSGKGDHVQLSALRRQLGIATKETPPSWTDAIHNFFATPLGKYTLADLCVRFDVFLKGPLDRFGKPDDGNSKPANKGSGLRFDPENDPGYLRLENDPNYIEERKR
jgi:hypothetical protein